jgi:hypothetical protein
MNAELSGFFGLLPGLASYRAERRRHFKQSLARLSRRHDSRNTKADAHQL